MGAQSFPEVGSRLDPIGKKATLPPLPMSDLALYWRKSPPQPSVRRFASFLASRVGCWENESRRFQAHALFRGHCIADIAAARLVIRGTISNFHRRDKITQFLMGSEPWFSVLVQISA